MGFPGQAAIDAIILVLVSTFGVVAAVYAKLLWHMRRDFFIVLR